jgi:hypothetical protein
VVNTRSWESIPEEEKGEGKLRRKARPGGWREAAPVLEQFYAKE